MALVHHIFGNEPDSKPSFGNVASAVFTTPQIAGVGYSEEAAREEFPNLNIFTSTFRRALRPNSCYLMHPLDALPNLEHVQRPCGRNPARDLSSFDKCCAASFQLCQCCVGCVQFTTSAYCIVLPWIECHAMIGKLSVRLAVLPLSP